MSAVWDLDEGSVMMVLPLATSLKTLDLTYALLGQAQLINLLSAFVNLEDLQVQSCSFLETQMLLSSFKNSCG